MSNKRGEMAWGNHARLGGPKGNGAGRRQKQGDFPLAEPGLSGVLGRELCSLPAPSAVGGGGLGSVRGPVRAEVGGGFEATELGEMAEGNVGEADFGPGFASGVEGDAAAHEGVADEVIEAGVWIHNKTRPDPVGSVAL